MDNKLSALNTRGTPDRAVDQIYVINGTNEYRSTINNELGITGNPVGHTDAQTLTNKTLTAPTISSPVLSGTITGTYTLGGTPTFPASVVTLTGSQTLTNKVLTSPTINTPTITNASITADTISGFSSANTGTIYGVAVTSGAISGASVTANTIPTAAVQNDAITAAKMLYGMVRQRQGGTTGNASWLTGGTSNTDVSATDVFIQVGSTGVVNSTLAITFPVAYNFAPIVMITTNTTTTVNAWPTARSVTTTGFTLALASASGTGATTESASWIAIGQ
jgi:fibronectin-binding autotransporter adhesin